MDHLNFSKNAPSWMDQSFFEKVVRQMEKDPEAQVENFKISAGSKPGEGFASSIFRVAISYRSRSLTNDSTKTISVIIKAQMAAGVGLNAGLMDVLHDDKLFRTEIEMYGKVLPEVMSLWLSVGDNDLLCAKLVYEAIEPSPVIILQDVKGEGFDVIEKPPQDFEVSKQIIRRLAKFHSATFYLQQEKKLDFKNFSTGIFTNPVLADMMFDQGLEVFIDVAKEWNGFDIFIPQLESFKKDYFSKLIKTYTPSHSEFGFNVLNHSDFHLKNMLFKKDAAGAIEDFYFIDFQVCVYATPAIDLIYALYYFVSDENRQNHRDELIATYHQQFVESLNKFGYLKPPPSLIDLQVELLRNGNLEVLVAICMIIFLQFDFTKTTAEDMDMGEGTKRAKIRMFNTPEFKDMIHKELTRFLYKGII